MHITPLATIFLRVLLFAYAISCGSFVLAEDAEESQLNFLGSTTLAYKNINFEIPAGGVSFSPDLMMLNMGGTLSYGNFFTTLNYDQTIKDDAQYAPGGSSLILMNREDMDISIGYYLGSGFSTFIGYKDGVLTADVTGETTGSPAVPVNPYQVEFRDKGPFVGISHTTSFEHSSLVINIAYADMDGTVKFGNNGGSKTKGDTTGFSYSIGWAVPVTNSTILTSKINLVRYEFDDIKMGTLSGGGSAQDLSFKQEFDIISFTLAHYF